MRTVLGVLLVAAVACAAPPGATAQPLHLVLTPSQKPTDLLAAGEEFGQALGKLYGGPVRVTVASDYAAVIEALRNHTADLAFVHPGGYVLASREAKARIVARNLWHGKSTFTSRIYVRKDGGIKTVEDLRGKTMACVDPRGARSAARPRLRRAGQARLRHRRLRAGRGPRLRSRARGRRAARRSTALSTPAATPVAMIEVTGLRVVLPPDKAAVDGVDLTIRPGEFVVILGPSGAGKTTFLRAINRLTEPTAGEVRVGGRAVTGADLPTLRAIRRGIGMVFQQFNLVRRGSVVDNVLAGRLGWTPALATLGRRLPAEDP